MRRGHAAGAEHILRQLEGFAFFLVLAHRDHRAAIHARLEGHTEVVAARGTVGFDVRNGARLKYGIGQREATGAVGIIAHEQLARVDAIFRDARLFLRGYRYAGRATHRISVNFEGLRAHSAGYSFESRRTADGQED